MKKSEISSLYRDLRYCWNLDTLIYITRHGVNNDKSIGLTKGTEGFYNLLDYITETGSVHSKKFIKDIGISFGDWYNENKEELHSTITYYIEGRTWDDEDEEYYGQTI